MLTFRIEPDADKWHAYCPELEGCHTFGDTREQALSHLKEAMMLYIEDEIEAQGFDSLLQQSELCLQ